jgi:hypothetical protein
MCLFKVRSVISEISIRKPVLCQVIEEVETVATGTATTGAEKSTTAIDAIEALIESKLASVIPASDLTLIKSIIPSTIDAIVALANSGIVTKAQELITQTETAIASSSKCKCLPIKKCILAY